MHYVAYYFTRFQDGHEESARVFADKAAALDWLGRLKSGFDGDNTDVKLFELGPEIPLKECVETEPQPAKVVKRYVVEDGGAEVSGSRVRRTRR